MVERPGLQPIERARATPTPHGSVTRVEVGASEALLIRHHVRALLLYLGARCATKTIDARQSAVQ